MRNFVSFISFSSFFIKNITIRLKILTLLISNVEALHQLLSQS